MPKRGQTPSPLSYGRMTTPGFCALSFSHRALASSKDLRSQNEISEGMSDISVLQLAPKFHVDRIVRYSDLVERILGHGFVEIGGSFGLGCKLDCLAEDFQ